jgi:hypothetical protein
MRPLRLLAPFTLSLACVAVDEDGTSLTSSASQPSDPDAGDDDDSTAADDDSTDPGDASDATSADASDATSVDASDDDPSAPDSSGADDPSDTDPTASDDTTGGGLPDGVLAQGEAYPADLVRVGDELFWANQDDAECIRRLPIAGGIATDVACEPDDDTLPLQVIPYGGGLAYSFMVTTQVNLQFGFGGVRLVDLDGGAPQTIDDGSRFCSTSNSPMCNDTLTASGTHLFWYAHELSEYENSIVHWDGDSKDAFDADSSFPYGPIATPTAVYWSATEAFETKPLAGLGGAPQTIGTTQGSTCGRAAAGETLYLTSRGTFVEDPALFRWQAGVFSNVRTLDDLVYDVDVDATHVYLAFDSRVDRLPLANLEGGAFETLVEGDVVGGILVDGGNLYWTAYDVGEVRVQALP